MITFQKARQIAEAEINKYQTLDDDSLIIIDDQTIEKDYAWIFPYTSKKYWETTDINYAIGGNGPIFISKLDGQISNYRTGLSIEEMIDEYEEENKIWNLALTDNIFSDTNNTLTFRQILGLTISEVASYKKNNKLAFESGSRTRLLKIQKQLSLKSITTSLTQRTLTDKT
jgi:Immunity protein 35